MFTLYGLCSCVASWMIESKGVWNLAKVRVSRLLGRARSVHRVKARKLKRFLLTLRDHFQIGNLLPILWVIKNLHCGSVVVETSSTCLKDGCHCLCYTTWNIVKRLKVMGLFFLPKKEGRSQGFRKRSWYLWGGRRQNQLQSLCPRWFLQQPSQTCGTGFVWKLIVLKLRVDFFNILLSSSKPFKADIAIASLAHVASSGIWNIPEKDEKWFFEWSIILETCHYSFILGIYEIFCYIDLM